MDLNWIPEKKTAVLFVTAGQLAQLKRQGCVGKQARFP